MHALHAHNMSSQGSTTTTGFRKETTDSVEKNNIQITLA